VVLVNYLISLVLVLQPLIIGLMKDAFEEVNNIYGDSHGPNISVQAKQIRFKHNFLWPFPIIVLHIFNPIITVKIAQACF